MVKFFQEKYNSVLEIFEMLVKSVHNYNIIYTICLNYSQMLHKSRLLGFCMSLFQWFTGGPTSSSRQRREQWSLLLSAAVQSHTVLLRDGCQLLQELGKQDDGKHSAFGLRGNGWAGGQDAQRRQRQSVPQGAVGKGRVQDEVPSLRVEALWEPGRRCSEISWDQSGCRL